MKTRALALCTLFALSSSAFAATFGGLNSDRAGSGYSLDSGWALTDFRNAIAAQFPTASTITGPTVNDISSANVLILGTINNAAEGATTLSPDEQVSLLTHVQAGGGALIFIDNDSFNGPTTSDSNNSFLLPFGIHATGTLAGGVSADTMDTPITNGANGRVWATSNFYSGYFDLTGLANIAAAFAPGEANVAYLAPGALNPGSGPVVFFSDSADANVAGNAQLLNYALQYTVDNSVAPAQATPEPTTAFLLAAAPLTLLLNRRRKA